MTVPGWRLLLGDCRGALDALGPAVADVAVTDPPWNLGKAYGRHDDAMPPADYLRSLGESLTETDTANRLGLVCVFDARHLPLLRADRHPCPRPVSVLRAVVELFCPPGGTVLDPFCGTGSRLAATLRTGRSAVGIELEPRFHDLAARRCAAAAAGRPEPR